MDKLPQEIVDRISSHLIWDLRSTLTVNSKFQASAEYWSGMFREFYLDRTTADKFVHTFSGRHFRHLRHLTFATTLTPDDTPPNHRWLDPSSDDDDDLPQCRESKKTLRKYDESFTEQIKFLFDTLSTVERRVATTYGPGEISLTILTPTMELDPSIYCRHRAHASHRVLLINPERLQELKSVKKLRVTNGAKFTPFEEPMMTLRKLDLRTLLDIAYKLPNLENLACAIGGDEWPTPLSNEAASHLWHMFQGPRRDSRHDFAQSLDPLKFPASLRELDLDFIYPSRHIESIDQRIPMPNLVLPLSYDPFSTSLRILSSGMRRMCLFAVVDKTLFWPANCYEPPSWPSLETLKICFHQVTPSGEWYFKGFDQHQERQLKGYELDESAYPPFETTADDEYWCEKTDEAGWDQSSFAQFHVVPNDELISPFLEAFAKAAIHMPKLKDATLWCPLSFFSQQDEFGNTLLYPAFARPDLIQRSPHDLAWGIAYAKPNQKPFSRWAGQDLVTERQLWWLVGNQWRPSAHLRELFQQIGHVKYDNGLLVERWSDEFYGDGLVHREIFDRYGWRTRS